MKHEFETGFFELTREEREALRFLPANTFWPMAQAVELAAEVEQARSRAAVVLKSRERSEHSVSDFTLSAVACSMFVIEQIKQELEPYIVPSEADFDRLLA